MAVYMDRLQECLDGLAGSPGPTELEAVKKLLEDVKEVFANPIKPPASWPDWLTPFHLDYGPPKGKGPIPRGSVRSPGSGPSSPIGGRHGSAGSSFQGLRRRQSSQSFPRALGSVGSSRFSPSKTDLSWREPPPRPKPTKSEHDTAVAAFRSVLNKLSKDNFERLSSELVAMSMPTKRAFDEIIKLVFDRAIAGRFFQRLYARLCFVLGSKPEAWCEVTLDGRPDGTFWWAFPQDPDEEATDEGKDEPRLVGVDGDETPSSKKETGFNGPFSSEEAARAAAAKALDLRRAILGLCQAAFQKGNDGSGLYFSTMTFIGELYMEGMAPLAIMYICLTNLFSNATEPSEDQVGAACHLLMTVGVKFSKEDMGQRKLLPEMLTTLTDWSKPGRLSSRLRFQAMDILDLAKRGWVLRGTQQAKKCVS